MRTLVCDSSALISLSLSCGLPVLSFLQEEFGARFLVPAAVARESIERPAHIGKYAASALRIGLLMRKGTLTPSPKDFSADAEKIKGVANRLFSAGGRPLEILHDGEAECLAALREEANAGLLVDEKTLRMLVEAPQRLGELLQEEYAGGVQTDHRKLEEWEPWRNGARVIRSAELVALAAQKGYFDDYGKLAGAAFLGAQAALRNAGCSITNKELNEYAELGLR